MNVDALDKCGGAAITVGALAPGQTFLSEPMAIPEVALRVSFEIRATPSTAVAPTLTVKIRQGNSNANATLVDRAITSPTAFTAFAAGAEAKALAADDVVANYVQLEIACTVGPCVVSCVASAR